MRWTEFRGYFGEYIAIFQLLLKGYKILAHRFKLSGGEVDIIAKRGNKISFVEVKTRKSEDKCFIALTPQQLYRIRKVSQIFLQNHPEYSNCEISFDVILIVDWKLPQHVENISM